MSRPQQNPHRVREMFGRIAGRYDLLNHLLSLNLDRGWRRRAARAATAGHPGGRVLDLCCGTGDLALELARTAPEAEIVACDFTRPMLERAAAKAQRRRLDQRVRLVEGDALRLPFPAGTFDAVTVGFGVRNLARIGEGLAQMRRVLRPGGRLVVLEFSQPESAPLAPVYRFYLQRVLPRLGDGVAGARGPYGYLARTIGEFPDAASLAGRIREAGFAGVGWECLTGGIVAVHTGLRAAG